jgi:ABC transport system ATP-binding/permease protein
MNESILKALIRLFAIVSDAEDDDNKFGTERIIVMDYLDRQYSHELVQTFTEYFDQQVKIFHEYKSHLQNSNPESNEIIGREKIEELCNQINEELETEQKIIVLVYLLDFINSDNKLTPYEIAFVTHVARYLKIPADEFTNLKAFTFNELESIIDPNHLLLIDSNPDKEGLDIKHMASEKLEGKIIVLNLLTTNTFVFRYYGHMALFLNGHLIKPNRSYIWSIGSVIRNSKIGTLYYNWMSSRFIQANVENKFVFVARDIEYNYRNSSNGIKKFNFNEESGRFICIIGGSGSGKSTLLNVLNGNIRPKNGKITINGYDIHENKELIKGVIGYVPQDDLLIKELTVFQNLYYNAKLCFSGTSELEIEKIVENALVDFDLVEARDLNVGDAFTTILSGGQRKRLNIALELIREPSILFIDEPTSGLSSADSEKVINLLKKQTFKGKLVITNIHQPSSDIFKMFDKLLVMDQGGRIIYYGHPISAVTYFKRKAQFPDAEESECLSCGNINTDQILRIVEARVVDVNGKLTRKRKTAPEEWYEMYQKSIDWRIKNISREHDSTVPKSIFKIPSHYEQFKLFLKRDVLAKFHNKQYLLLNALEAPILALILAFFTKKYSFVDGIPRYIFGENNNIPAFIFMAVIVSLFLGMVLSAEEIFKDRKILKREKFLNLSRSSYLFSKIVILFSLSAIQTLMFVLIGNNILQIKGMTMYYWLILFTTSCWANIIGLNISAGLNSVVTIYILIPLILVPQLLFSGVVVEFDDMHNKIASDKNVPVIGDVMASRWAYEALMVAQFKKNSFERNFFNIEKTIKNTIYYKSFAIPELRSMAAECQSSNIQNLSTFKTLQNIRIIKNEIEKICRDLNFKTPSFKDSITYTTIRTTYKESLANFFNIAERNYIRLYNDAIQARDNKYNDLVSKLGSEEAFLIYKQKYYNKQVANVVTNEKDFKEIEKQNNEMLPVKNAIYRDPLSTNGRGHFYAPVKKISSFKIDTFWYDLIIIWLFTGIMFVFLYYDLLRRILAYFETLRLNRANRRRLLGLINISEGRSKPNKKTIEYLKH